jgi:hypothetical protein
MSTKTYIDANGEKRYANNLDRIRNAAQLTLELRKKLGVRTKLLCLDNQIASDKSWRVATEIYISSIDKAAIIQEVILLHYVNGLDSIDTWIDVFAEKPQIIMSFTLH